MSQERMASYVAERIGNWETGMSKFFTLWNEWVASYEMKYVEGDRRPDGVSKNVVAETPRAVNTLATTITRMQTANDPPFELRQKPGTNISEQQIFDMETHVSNILSEIQFKRHLLKGNRGACLFGTQVWEKPYIARPDGFEGTAFKPLSLLQCAFDPTVYDMEYSDFFATVTKLSSHNLRNMAYSSSDLWDINLIEKAIAEDKNGSSGFAKSTIDQRRQRAGYEMDLRENNHELILFHGRMSKEVLESEEFGTMWQKFGRTDDPRLVDITIGILNRTHMVRLHPTPYGRWSYLYSIGHYIEFELEPMGYGVGALGGSVQKDINRVTRLFNDVSKFSLYNMFFAGRGSGLKDKDMNVIPWSAIKVDDVTQIQPIRPQIEGIGQGLAILKQMIEDFRGVTHASSTLQAVVTGATATEASLAQNEGLRAISVSAEVMSETVIKDYLRTVVTNLLDQNPYDTRFVPVDIIPKVATDKDYRPEQSKKLLEFLNFVTSIRNVMPIDFNPMPIVEYLGRAVGINPREFAKPRPQADRMLEVLRRLSNNGSNNSMAGEVAGAGQPDGNISDVQGLVPNSPVPSLAGTFR